MCIAFAAGYFLRDHEAAYAARHDCWTIRSTASYDIDECVPRATPEPYPGPPDFNGEAQQYYCWQLSTSSSGGTIWHCAKTVGDSQNVDDSGDFVGSGVSTIP